MKGKYELFENLCGKLQTITNIERGSDGPNLCTVMWTHKLIGRKHQMKILI